MSAADPVRIGGRLVGAGHPCYVIAEAGVNHNGDLDLARHLVEAAAGLFADAVKFQKRTPRDILVQEALEREYSSPTALAETYGEHREKLELSEDDYSSLSELAAGLDITLLASAWDAASADFLEELGIPAFKVASADVTNLPLVDHIAKKNRPMLISTGMSSMEEISDAVDVVRRHHDELVLLQCTSAYPAENDELNLRAIETLRREFDCLVGYSGHERGLAPTEAAVALDACVVERHFTLDRAMAGPDHAASLEPGGLARLIRDIRNIEDAMGSPEKRILDSELPQRDRLAKSVVAAQDIPAGTRIELSMLAVKGPGHGISPRFLSRLEGVTARMSIDRDTLIPREALDW